MWVDKICIMLIHFVTKETLDVESERPNFRSVFVAGGVALDAQLVRGAVLEYENLEDL